MNSAKQQATGSTGSQKAKPVTSQTSNRLNPSEIESLLSEHKRDQKNWDAMLKGKNLSHLKAA